MRMYELSWHRETISSVVLGRWNDQGILLLTVSESNVSNQISVILILFQWHGMRLIILRLIAKLISWHNLGPSFASECLNHADDIPPPTPTDSTVIVIIIIQ
jgi:hypothetical protein